MPELHRRAAAWFEANGLPELAIEHAQMGADAERVARLVSLLAQPTFSSGRVKTVLGWIDWFDERDLIEQYPQVAAYAAVVYADRGRTAQSERCVRAVERTAPDVVLPDGSTIAGLQAYLRLTAVGGSPADLRRDAELGLAELSPGSRMRPTMMVGLGLAAVLEGDLERADPLLARAADATLHTEGMAGASIAVAERALIAIERNDWAQAEPLAERALAIVQDNRLDDYALCGLALVVGARMALHRGELEVARTHVAGVVRLRPRFSSTVPYIAAQTLLELAKVYTALSDPGGARAVLREFYDVLRRSPDVGVLSMQANELQAKLEAMRNVSVSASSLTGAELRLVPHLATHLTFPEIGTRLHISRHTVKTQAISIYQKLGVSSRGEAIDQMREIGLLSA